MKPEIVTIVENSEGEAKDKDEDHDKQDDDILFHCDEYCQWK